MNRFRLLIVCFSTLSILFSQSYLVAQKKIELQDIWKGKKFRTNYVEAFNFMKNSTYYTILDNTNQGLEIVKKSIRDTAFKEVLVSSNLLKNIGAENISHYSFSEQENKILLFYDVENIYRHSTIEHVIVFDIINKKTHFISAKGKIQLATFSPDAQKVAYVRDHNLLYYDLMLEKEVRITHDGSKNNIIYGATDWVYEEEFSLKKGYEWSPDSKNLVYYKFDETNVKQFSMDMYENHLYPQPYKFKYPKAGEENSRVTLWVYSLLNSKNFLIQNISDYEYIPRIKFTKNQDILSIQLLNRHQNKLKCILYNISDNASKTFLEEQSNTYIDIYDDVFFLNNQNQCIWTSDRSGYKHIYLYTLDNSDFYPVTSGNWEVVDILYVNEKSNTIYYTSKEDDSKQVQLYQVSFDGKNKKRISNKIGTHDVVFSPDGTMYIDYYSKANHPVEISLHQPNGKMIQMLEENTSLKQTLQEYSISKQEFFTIPVDTIELNAWMIKPADFNENKKYPVLMYVYGGPGSQTVTNAWGGTNFIWYQYLAQQGYIIVSVDNRGTGGRGSAFKKCTYKKLGEIETSDQISAAKYFANLPYVDKTRIGIQGWSYGGYMSSLCITMGADYFKSAIAVAPVTHWKFYDSIYTERFMQTPQENEKNYDDFAPLNHADKLKGNYLLIHGMADDNVHFQNSVAMVNALIEAGKHFDFYMYPDKNHGIYGGNARFHVYEKMTRFILEKL